MNNSLMSRRSVDSAGLLQIRERFEGSRHKFLSSDGRYIYHIGLIDYLQDFNLDKKMENLLKQRLLGKGEGISAVHPKKYAARFIRFMRDHVIIDQKKGKGNKMKNELTTSLNKRLARLQMQSLN
jgi:hypothetical protein